MKKGVLIIIPILILVAAGIFFAKPKGLKIETYTVKKEAVKDVYKEDGVVSFGDTQSILSKVSGSILSIEVEENQEVKKGDVLITIDSRELVSQKEMLIANKSGLTAKKEESDIQRLMSASPTEYLKNVRQGLETAQIAYETAQTDLSAKQELFNAGAISKAEFDLSRTNLENAKNTFESSKNRYQGAESYLNELKKSGLSEKEINTKFYESIDKQIDANIASNDEQIKQLDLKIADCTITALADGIVSSIPVKGMTGVTAGIEVVRINENSSKLQVKSKVLSDIVPYLNVGDEVVLKFEFRGKEFETTGKISKIYDFANEGKSALGLNEYRVDVVIDIDNVDNSDNKEIGLKDIKNGYSTEVEYKLFSSDSAITVPVSALFEEDNKNYVFKIVDSKAVKTEVKIDYTSSTFSVISEGLLEGDEIAAIADNEKLSGGVKIIKK